jgi:hypothetical protein
MAKTDLLKEAIADAKAVKETALANAKIALEEAFAPRIQSMLSAKLSEELMDEQDELEDAELDMAAGEEGDVPAELDGDMAMDDMGDEGEPMDVGDIELDTDMDGEMDFTGDVMAKPGMDAEPAMDDMGDDMGEPEMDAVDAELDGPSDEMGIEEIIRELEEDLDEGEGHYAEEEEPVMGENYSEENNGTDEGQVLESTDKSIDELIEAILAEEEEEKEEEKEEETVDESNCGGTRKKNEEMKEALEEAYDTVGHLKSVINEVNLLNAKLLYTNKLFRNFELNESQKMKVIENFDRAGNTREAKLVFATLAESFHKPSRGKKVVKESRSMASKPVATTAPSKETTQVLTEGFEQANRWKKLAGLIK